MKITILLSFLLLSQISFAQTSEIKVDACPSFIVNSMTVRAQKVYENSAATLESLASNLEHLLIIKNLAQFCKKILASNSDPQEIIDALLAANKELEDQARNEGLNYNQEAALQFVLLQSPLIDNMLKVVNGLPLDVLGRMQRIDLKQNDISKSISMAVLDYNYVMKNQKGFTVGLKEAGEIMKNQYALRKANIKEHYLKQEYAIKYKYAGMELKLFSNMITKLGDTLRKSTLPENQDETDQWVDDVFGN